MSFVEFPVKLFQKRNDGPHVMLLRTDSNLTCAVYPEPLVNKPPRSTPGPVSGVPEFAYPVVRAKWYARAPLGQLKIVRATRNRQMLCLLGSRFGIFRFLSWLRFNFSSNKSHFAANFGLNCFEQVRLLLQRGNHSFPALTETFVLE